MSQGDSQIKEQDPGRLRKRLWGAAVLIAIAVIVLPVLLDGAGTESQFRRVESLREEPASVNNVENITTIQSLPQARAIESPLSSTERLDRILTDSPTTGQAPGSNDIEREGQLRDELRNSQEPLTVWVVQADVFSEEETALQLRDQLRGAGFASFVRDRDSVSEPFRVLVGPMIKQAAAERAKSQVARLLNNAPEIMVYP